MKKVFTLVLIALVTVALVYALVRYLGLQGFPFAFSLNFLLMAGVLAFTETLKSPFDSPYFDEQPWERRGKLYEALGVNVYRKLLVGVGWEKLNKKSRPVQKSAGALANLYRRTKQDEFGHLVILVVVLGFTVFVAFKFGFVASLWLLGLNILLNLYPVMLQRYNRPRIARAIRLGKHG